MIDATISIITFNRPVWLSRCLKALGDQELKKNTSIDLLVVDNACNDDIKKIVQDIASEKKIKISYMKEPVRGIVAARNKCVDIFLRSDSKNLIFIDDDEWPQEKNWIQSLLDKKDIYHADIVTSHVIPVGEAGTPDWAVNLIYGKNKNKEGDIVKVFYTNNLLLSRSVLVSVRPAFDSRFSMTGASDYHFSLKCAKKGFRAVYVDAPVVEEFPLSRAKLRWFVRRGFRSGIGFTRSHLFEDPCLVAFAKINVFFFLRILRGVASFILGVVLFDKLKIVNGLFRISSGVGTVAGLVGVKYDEYSKIHGK